MKYFGGERTVKAIFDGPVKSIMTIDQQIRNKVLELKKLGRSRTQTLQELESLGFKKISTGSISNILKESKSKNNSAITTTAIIKSEDTSHQDSQPQSSLITNSDMNNPAGSPVLMARDSGTGLAPLISQGQDSKEQEIAEPKPSEPDIDFSNEPFPDSYDSAEIDYDVNPQRVEIVESTNETKESDSEDLDLGIDYDQNWSTHFWARIVKEKEQRKRELEIIKRERYSLNGERRQLARVKSEIELQKKDLELRQNKIRDDELLIPFVKSLKTYGATEDILFSYVSMVRNRALEENIDVKTAANKLTYVLLQYCDLETLKNTINIVKQELSNIKTFGEQQQQAIKTLANLKSAGYTERDIAGLLGQPNGHNSGLDVNTMGN